MQKRSTTLSTEERARIVLRLLRKEESAVEIARRAKVSERTLYRWRDDFLRGGKQALNGRSREQSEQAKPMDRLRAELTSRNQVIGEISIISLILLFGR